MALKRVARSVTVARRDGQFVASAPAGWQVWSSDGRVVPPPGTYRVSHTGMTVQKRTTGGVFTPVEGDLVQIESGEAIAADYRNDGDVLMVELIPPPLTFVGFVGGGRGGADLAGRAGANRRAQNHRQHRTRMGGVRHRPRRPLAIVSGPDTHPGGAGHVPTHLAHTGAEDVAAHEQSCRSGALGRDYQRRSVPRGNHSGRGNQRTAHGGAAQRPHVHHPQTVTMGVSA